ncbi:MAG: hypothetical protein ABI919_03155 [Ramlibacter sp.]
MNKNLKSSQAPRARRSLLASAAVVAMGVAAPALADMPGNGIYSMGTYEGSPGQTLTLSDYVMWITTPQLNSGMLSSTASGVRYQANLYGGGNIGYYEEGPVFAFGTPVTQANNSIAALATANQNTSAIALGLLANQVEGADGVATLTGQLRNGAATQALVQNSSVETVLGAMPVAAHVLHANSIGASTTLNQSASSVSGEVPVGYASQRPGFAAAQLQLGNGTSSGVDSQSNASVGVSTNQVALNAGQRAGSNATVSNGLVLLDIASQGTPTIGETAAPGLSVTNNSIGAQYRGNQSENRFLAQTGSAAFQGSVAVGNVQATNAPIPDIGEGPVSSATARVVDSAIVADVRTTFYAGEGEGYASGGLTGALVLTGNTLSAGSTGNIASGRDANGNVVAGNSIVFAGGADIRGAQSAGTAMAGMIEGGTNASAAADLSLVNAQGNQNTVLSSEMAFGLVGAFVDNTLQTGSVSLTGNGLSATASGNVAGNRISAAGTSISANAAASNVQGNSATDILAANIASEVSANVGTGYLSASGTVSVSSNGISSSASGNLADTHVALSATHLATGGRPAGASSDTWGFPLVSATGDAVAVNMQGNFGGTISAETAGATIAASFADTWYGEGQRTGITAANVSVNDNAIRSQALGNDAATSVTLAGATGNSTAALGNSQFNDTGIQAAVRDSAVSLSAGAVNGSNLAINGNTLAATAHANNADNRITAQFETLQAPVATYIPAFSINGNSGVSVAAAQAIVSAQHNSGAVTATNLSEGPMVVASLGQSTWSEGNFPYENIGGGTQGSSITVKGNAVSAAATANQAANSIGWSVGTLNTGEGFNAPVAAITNLQTNWSEGHVSATAGNAGGGLLIGAQYTGGLSSSQIAVADNTVSAQSQGNSAVNRLNASGVNFQARSSGYGYEGMPDSDFSVLSQQTDSGDTRSATTSNANIGIDGGSSYLSYGLADANLSVTGNRNLAEARNNNAVNSLGLAGFSTLATSALVGNMQDSGTTVQATAAGSTTVRAGNGMMPNVNLAVTGNTAQAMAVANSADNTLSAQATQLQGKSSPWVITGMPESGYLGAPDFAVFSMQSQGGAVTASANASSRIDLDSGSMFGGGSMLGGSATLTGNTVAAIAQANSVSNALSLQAVNASAVTAAVMSGQYASGPVNATAGAPAGEGAFAITANYTSGTPVVVADNRMRASAGLNEAFNQMVVSGTTVAGRGLGNNPSAYGMFESGGPAADFSVANQQSGWGDATAVALPAQIGASMGGAWGGSVAVTGNDVTAKASVNNASNVLSLASQSTLSASGAVSNMQSAEGGSGQAWIGNGVPAAVGVSSINLGNTVVAVTGNSLNAIAGANQASNALNATAANGVSGPGNVASFAVLNQQSNAASMNAVVQNTAIGVTMSGYNLQAPGYFNGNGISGGSASVQGNSVLASGYGNTASNALGLTAPAAAAGTASASIVNRQTNSATISASVSNVNVGVGGGMASGSSIAITGNAVTAQAVGNSATNVLSIK